MALWKDVVGYEGLYLVSDDGKVVSLPRLSNGRNKAGPIVRHVKGRKMKTCLRGRGNQMYEAVSLSKCGVEKRYSIHRLVAEAFIPNPDNLPEVNHKDVNPLNNRVENLEWCTRQYNIDYSKSKCVEQSKDGIVIGKYKSISHASRETGIGRRSINNALCGWSNSAGGFQWTYAE